MFALPFSVFVFCVLFYGKILLYIGNSLFVKAFITNVKNPCFDIYINYSVIKCSIASDYPHSKYSSDYPHSKHSK